MARFKKLYELNEQLHQLAARHMGADLNELNHKSFFAAFILGKAYKTHEAIMLLCKQGYGEDAFMLSRTLFELMIMLLYILSDNTDDRLIRYAEHDWVNRKQMLDYVATNDRLLKGLNEKIKLAAGEPDVLAIIEAEYTRVMNKHGYDFKGWSDKSIQKMAEEVGRGDAYKTVYKLQCNVGHTNPRSMNEYIQQTKDGLIINTGPNVDMAETTLVIAFDFFGTVFEKVSKQLGWETETELDSLGQDFSEQSKK
jgi:hypothetical protein